MTKYIFLDIDGVLNSEHTWDEYCENGDQQSASTISDQYLENLQKIVEKTDAKLILSSSWRTYFDDNIDKPINIWAIYLTQALSKHNLKLHDATPFVKGPFSS